MESWIMCVVTKLHAMKKIQTFFFLILSKQLDAIHHDDMFVNIIFTKYINARIHQGLNPKPLWKHAKIITTKPF
jgi:hypothetical protein